MIFRAQYVVGALLLSIALTSASDVKEEQNEQDRRELAPYSRYNQGLGFPSQNNRFSLPRTRGQEQGSAYLKPTRGAIFNQRTQAPPGQRAQAPKSSKGQNPKAPKVEKAYKNAKHNNEFYNKSAKTTKYGGRTAPATANRNNIVARPNRGRSYLNSMHWQRIPGQPIFVSSTDVPIIILDKQPNFKADGDNPGEFILVDEDGNEIIVTTDLFGEPFEVVQSGDSGDDDGDDEVFCADDTPCLSETFCNYDGEVQGESGFCEPCVDNCEELGLPPNGVTDCEERC